MDAYLGYNQILMDKVDRNMKTFVTDGTNYMYNVLPFGLKNAGHMYQKWWTKSSKQNMLEVYMDDIVIKSVREH